MRASAAALALLLASALRADENALGRARTALREGRLPEAVAQARAAVQQDPKSSEAHHWLGKAYGLSAQRAALVERFSLAKKCGQEFRTAVELDPANLDAALDLVKFRARAPHFLGGSREGAKALAEEIGRRSASRGRLAHGILSEEARDRAGAEREYRAAFALDPHDTRVLNGLVDFLANGGRLEEALAVCRAALAGDPQDAEAREVEASLLARAGRVGPPTLTR
jgi:Tfp pilus assembly protein PilF